jgi:hypothetical protein
MRADGMPVGTPFAKGTSGKVLHRRRVTAKVAELVESFGGADKLSALDLVYIEKAAVLLTRRARLAEDEVRALNTARGLIASVERRRGRHDALSADFASLLPDGAP